MMLSALTPGVPQGKWTVGPTVIGVVRRQRTGVGLVALFGVTEGRSVAADIPPERRGAFERGFAMKTDEAIAYALAAPTAKYA